MQYEVIGPFEIGGVKPGGIVELDTETVNVDALIEAGHVKPAKTRRGKAHVDAGLDPDPVAKAAAEHDDKDGGDKG